MGPPDAAALVASVFKAHRHARPPLPRFVVGFTALVDVNSVITIPTEAKQTVLLVCIPLELQMAAEITWRML